MGKIIKRDHEKELLGMASIALKDIMFKPASEPKPKQPSKKLQQIVTKIGSTFMTLEDSINEALELGRIEGFTDIEIGDMIRAEFKRINRPRMTLARYLPVTAKHMEKARPKSDFGNKMLPNKPVAISTENETLPSTNTTTVATKFEQLQRPGKWNQGPEEFEIERLYEYDLEYCRTTIQWLYEDHMNLMKNEKQQLEESNKALKSATETIETLRKKILALNDKAKAYTAYDELEIEDNTGIWVECVANPDEGDEILNCSILPLIVHVDALNQTATVELDIEQHMENIKQTSKAEPEAKADSSKSKSKKSTKTKKHD